MSWEPGFFEAFTAASGTETRLSDLDITIAAALTAHALNIGFSPVLNPGNPALTRNRISHVDQNYLRGETYSAANAPIVAAQADIDLAKLWGGGLVAAVDGIRFVVPVRSIHKRPNPKYFGRRRGTTMLNLVTDHALSIASMVVSGTPRDSLHVIDLIYRQETGPKPDIIITDTGSYSDIVFGLLQLLGFEYRPQLADLPDQKLWRINPAADYGTLNTAVRGKINVDGIKDHWPDILRIVGSIHTGTVTAYEIIRMVSHRGQPTQLGLALADYGRIFKTLHILTYVDDEPYRRDIKFLRNLQEGRHALARHVFHGRRGELHQAYQEGMEDQLGALGLVVNTLILWNTVYLDAAIKQLRQQGHDIDDQDVERLSPYMRKHINVHGHYSFRIAPTQALRAFRDPAQPADAIGP